MIRHSKSENKPSKFATDVSLSPEGWNQADNIPWRLPRKPDLIIYSDYGRAIQTAKPTRNFFPDTPSKEWREVREFSYLKVIDGVPSTKEERSSFVEDYWARSETQRAECEKSESFTNLIQRADNVLYELRQEGRQLLLTKHQGEHMPIETEANILIVVFTHEQFMRAVQCRVNEWIGLHPNKDEMRFFRQLTQDRPIPNGGFLLVTLDQEEPEWRKNNLYHGTCEEVWSTSSNENVWDAPFRDFTCALD